MYTGRSTRCNATTSLWHLHHQNQWNKYGGKDPLSGVISTSTRRRCGPTHDEQYCTRRRCITRVAVVSPNVVFDIATVGVMPVYALMMWFPRSSVTKKLMGSNMLLFIAGSFLYAYTILSYGGYEIFKPLVESIKDHGLSTDSPGRYLAIMAEMLGNSTVTAITWVHLLLLDLFQARWVYHDALRHNVASIHSLILCFMVGPLGLLSHILTKRFNTRGRIKIHGPNL